MKSILFICLIFVCSISYAGYVTPEPPKIADNSTYNYVRALRNNLNKPQVVTKNPNGNINGEYGQLMIYNNSGTFYLMVNISSPTGTTWRGILLGVI